MKRARGKRTTVNCLNNEDVSEVMRYSARRPEGQEILRLGLRMTIFTCMPGSGVSLRNSGHTVGARCETRYSTPGRNHAVYWPIDSNPVRRYIGVAIGDGSSQEGRSGAVRIAARVIASPYPRRRCSGGVATP